VAAFALAQLALTVAAVLAGLPPFDGATWTRYDSSLYLTIASRGYETAPCPPLFGGPDELCGTAGWFPAYPGLVAVPYHLLGVPLGEAGLLVSLACCLAMLVVLWAWVLDGRPTPGNLLALIFAAFCPAMVYTHAVFPTSLAALAILTWAGAVRRERWRLAFAAGVLGGLSYPIVVLLAPVSAAWWLLRRRHGAQAAPATALLAVAGPAVGFALALAVIWAWTGQADAYFATQAKYDHGFHAPWTLVHDVAKGPFQGRYGPRAILAIHELAMLGLIALLFVGAGRATRRALPTAGLLLAGAVGLWLIPRTQQDVSWYRGDTLTLLAAPLVAVLRPWRAVLIATVGLLLAIPMTQAFLQAVLV
jgi:hypothetical protein